MHTQSMQESELPSVDVYVIKTPRQWWLAQGISEHLNKPAVMVLSEGFKGAHLLKEIIESQVETRFVKVFWVPGKLTGQEKSWFLATLHRRLEWRGVRNQLNALLKEFRVNKVFTANLASLPIQYLQTSLESVPFHVLDDGLESYQYKYVKPKNKLSLIYSRLKYGFKVKSASSDSIFPFYTDGWFFNSKIVHKRFKTLKMHQIQTEWFQTPAVLRTGVLALQKFGMDVNAWRQPKIVFVFSTGEFLSAHCANFNLKSFQEKIARFLTAHTVAEHKIWVKYHPRENQGDIFQLASLSNDLREVPTTIPFEILVAGLLPGDLVVGEVSTVLFDIAIKRQDVGVWSLDCIEPGSEAFYLFKNAGVCFFS